MSRSNCLVILVVLFPGCDEGKYLCLRFCNANFDSLPLQQCNSQAERYQQCAKDFAADLLKTLDELSN